mgnify:CR=1 FL=1
MQPIVISKSAALVAKPNSEVFEIPQEWFDAINELLKHYRGQPLSIKISQIKEIYLKIANEPKDIKPIWLDIEPYYIADGWTVTYTKPEPGSTEVSYFTFK